MDGFTKFPLKDFKHMALTLDGCVVTIISTNKVSLTLFWKFKSCAGFMNFELWWPAVSSVGRNSPKYCWSFLGFTLRSKWAIIYIGFGYGCYELGQITGVEVSVWWVRSTFHHSFFFCWRWEIPFSLFCRKNKLSVSTDSFLE